MTSDAAAPTLPRRFGRYDVAATIAEPRTAGGSTVLVALARATTTSEAGSLALSFSPLPATEPTKTLRRPVAIKRIAPSLNTDVAATAKFLETARATTSIRHANVAEILEVGSDGGEIFLVMDHLMGETAASLMRRLHSNGERLDPTLAAHVIAEAAAGLEAGHAAGVLHAQLSPHDIFISYGGGVHVLDIGIAHARRALTGERAFGIETEYASPEECREETLDRRTDVFSLGAMLWELLTGLSPFERADPVQTMRAICEESVVPPKKIVPGLAKELSDITLQALARDRAARHQTAQALRAALVDVVNKRVIDPSADEQLGTLMRRVFAKREKDKRELLWRVANGKDIGDLDVKALDRAASSPRPVAVAPRPRMPPPVPRPAVAEEIAPEPEAISVSTAPARSHPPPDVKDQPSVILTPTADPLPVGALVPSTPPAPEPSAPVFPPFEPPAFRRLDEEVLLAPAPVTRRSPAWIAVPLVVAVLSAALVLVVRRRPQVAVTTPIASASIPTAVATKVDPPVVSAAPVVSASAPPPADDTVLHIETVPSQASIFIAGTKRGTSPVDLRLPKSDEAVVVEIRHPGYMTMKERIVPDVHQRLKLTLVAARGAPSSAAPAPAPYRKFE